MYNFVTKENIDKTLIWLRSYQQNVDYELSRKIYYVYCYTNKINGKKYVGKTGDLKERMGDHRRANKEENKVFYKAIKKYGINNFIFSLFGAYKIEKDAYNAEIYFIALYKSNDEYGYNCTSGGIGMTGNSIRVQLARKQIAVANIGKVSWNKGKKATESHKRNISNGLFLAYQLDPNLKVEKSIFFSGRKITEEAKKKMSESRKGNKGYNFGKTLSASARQKVSNFQSTKNRKPISQEGIEKIRTSATNQDHKFRIPKQIKQEIIVLFATYLFTKQQLADKFNLKFNTIVKILSKKKIIEKPLVKRVFTKPIDKNIKQEIIALFNTSNYSQKQLSIKFNIKYKTICYIISDDRKLNKLRTQ